VKRGQPLRRVTPLRARSALKATAKPKPYRPKASITPALRFVLWSRAAGRCEHCGLVVPLNGYEAHHRQRRREGDHSAANLLVLCSASHKWITEHPAVARENGWIVSAWSVPSDVPFLHWSGDLLRLTALGTYEEVQAA
jgi:hypothetical protein